MSRKDYIAIAKIIADQAEVSLYLDGDEETLLDDSNGAVSAIASGLANLFASENPRFDRQRFLFACGL